MKVIIIRGQENAGKTTTAALVYKELWLNHCEKEHYFNQKKVLKDSLEYNENGSFKDFTAILKWKNKEIKIGIASQADWAPTARKELDYLVKQENVDVLIGCARSRDRPNSVYAVIKEELELIGEFIPDKWWVKHSIDPAEKEIVKQSQIKEIVEEIKTLIK